MKNTVFSGIQPSGELTIGNYMGAFRQWITMQAQHNCLFSIVDLHAITVKQDPKILQQNTIDCLALLIAMGIDPKQSIIFIQSLVPAHSELAWLLNCYTNIGELNRMTQFKDKSTNTNNINVGLFAYPTLQAADILLYKANLVPVGADQKQHLELCRDIAIRFNHQYGEVFTVPDPLIATTGAKIMSLQNPNKKMSKSDSSNFSYISLLDDTKLIEKKFKKSVTDSDNIITYDEQNKPGVTNLLNLLHLSSNISIDELLLEFHNKGYGELKLATASAITKLLIPIQEKFYDIKYDQKLLQDIIVDGAAKANIMANQTLQQVKNAIGLISN